MPDVTIYFDTHPDNMSGYTFTGTQKHTTEISTGKYSCEGLYLDGSDLKRNIYFPLLDCGFINTTKNVQWIIAKDIECDSNFGELDITKDLKYIITGRKGLSLPTTYYKKPNSNDSYLKYDSKYIDGGRIIDGPQ